MRCRPTLIAALAGLVLTTAAYAKQPWLEIDLSEFTLYCHTDSSANDSIISYPIAIGKPGHRTPTGSFFVEQVVRYPAWCPDSTTSWIDPEVRAYVARHRCIPYGHEYNSLRGYWLRLGSHFGIHGSSIRRMRIATSHGCVRTLEEDIIALIEERSVRKGTRVVIHD